MENTVDGIDYFEWDLHSLQLAYVAIVVRQCPGKSDQDRLFSLFELQFSLLGGSAETFDQHERFSRACTSTDKKVSLELDRRHRLFLFGSETADPLLVVHPGAGVDGQAS